MEYLMTYGWAILIIAVVLGALFQLGVFSGIGVPRAQAGNCQVIKAGSGISQTVSLEGECQGQEPEYVASIPVSGDGISVTGVALPLGSSARTLTGWFQVPSNGGYLDAAGWFGPSCTTGYITALGQWPGDTLYFWGWDDFQSSFIIQPHVWYFAAASYTAGSTSVTVYLDGSSQTGTLSGGVPLNTQPGSVVYMGHDPVCGDDFVGLLSNVQIYNTSLSANEIQALYVEGIGGAPINPQYIVGWWPLNGNAQDYSGNNNNGQATGITYSSSWTNGYTAP